MDTQTPAEEIAATESAKVDQIDPEQVVAELMEKIQAEDSKRVVATLNGHDFTIAELKRVFDCVADPTDWRKPWSAWVPFQAVGLVREAVRWFHGDFPKIHGFRPIDGKILMSGEGYQGW